MNLFVRALRVLFAVAYEYSYTIRVASSGASSRTSAQNLRSLVAGRPIGTVASQCKAAITTVACLN